MHNKQKNQKRKRINHNGNFQKIQDSGMQNKRLVDVIFGWYMMHILIFVIRWDIIFGFWVSKRWFKVFTMFQNGVQWLRNMSCWKKNSNHIFICASFFDVIFCSCHIKTCCFSHCIVSWRLLAFLVLKKSLEFVRKVVKPTFASGDESSSWFPTIPSKHD